MSKTIFINGLSLSLTRSTQRQDDFTCPEGGKHQRWLLQLIAEDAPHCDDDIARVEFASPFTAFGLNADTTAGAIQSIYAHLSAYAKAYPISLQVEKAKYPAASSNLIPVERLTFSAPEAIDNSLVAAYIAAVNPERTAFGLDELNALDQYRYNLYGLQWFLERLFGGDDTYYTAVDQYGERFNHPAADAPMFTTLDDMVAFFGSITITQAQTLA